MASERLKQLLAFLEAAPEDPFSLYSVAYEYQQLGDLPKARSYFERLRKLHPTYVGTYYHLGKTLEQLEGKTAALPVYEQGMQIARQQSDMHAFGELQRALQSAQGLDYEDEV
jgi:tetratricopeptide (TPR) repeat protein